MASSLSSAASQIRVSCGTPSPRNVVFKQGSLNSNRVSFGLPPRSSSLTLSSSSSIRRTANGILPVAAVGNGNSYNELERLAVEAAKILVKEVTNMFGGGDESIKEKRSGDDIDKTKKNHADFAYRREKFEQVFSLSPEDVQDKVRRTTLEKMRVADEVDRVMQEEKRKRAETAAQEVKEKRSCDVDETAEKAENHAASGNRTSTNDNLKELTTKATTDISKNIVKIFEEFGAELPQEAVEPLVELALELGIKYFTTVEDTYVVGDYIKTRIGTDIVEGVVISKDWNVTRIETLAKEVIAIDNHKLSGWVQTLSREA